MRLRLEDKNSEFLKKMLKFSTWVIERLRSEICGEVCTSTWPRRIDAKKKELIEKLIEKLIKKLIKTLIKR